MMEKEGARKRYDNQSDRRSQYGSSRSSSSEFWQRKSFSTEDTQSWRRPSSSSEDTQSWRRSSSSSEDAQSWRRPSSSSEDPQSWRRPSSSWKQRNVGDNSDAVNTQARPEQRSWITASALQRGKVISLDSTKGYGFLAPMGTAAPSNNVYFKFGGTSNVTTGMFQLEVGDIFEYVSNESPDRPWAVYACLVQCNPRSPESLVSYLDTLLSQSEVSTGGNVLREITKCPAGFLQVLNFQKPPNFDLVYSVLQLVNILSHHDEAELHTVRLKQLYRLFCDTAFLQSSLIEYCVEIFRSATAEKLLKEFLISLAEHCPETVSVVLPLLNDMVLQTKSARENIDCQCQFLLRLLTAQTGNAASAASDNLPWKKTPLVPEITDGPTDKMGLENCLKGLPSVKKGSYGSIDVYMDTYFRLLKEDCFWGLKKGISDLRKKSLQGPRDIRIWTNGLVLGIHFGGSYSGITVAIQVEKLRNNKHPMSGSLLYLSDDGGNFDSPICGVVANCEDSMDGMVIFAGIVDGRGGAGDVETQAIGRLLVTGSNIVLAESPTYYRAYQPVLKAMQEKDMENFPFKEELIYAEWPNSPPEYLTPSTTLNWRCLFDEVKESSIDENISLREKRDRDENLEKECSIYANISLSKIRDRDENLQKECLTDAIIRLKENKNRDESLDKECSTDANISSRENEDLDENLEKGCSTDANISLRGNTDRNENPALHVWPLERSMCPFQRSIPSIVHRSIPRVVGIFSGCSGQAFDEVNTTRGQVHELDNLLKSGHKSSLDDSQIEAIKLALSNRLVLIQGPPGTGKSYVGVKILELLLTADTLPSGPILVMTYKNHGLDQFLLTCLKFCPNLVRIGGRSEEPELILHNLSSKMGRMNEYRSDWIECKLELEQVQTKMEMALQQLRESNVFNVESVIDHMPDKHVRQLLSKTESGKKLLGHFPEEISLLESIGGGLGRGEETRNLVTLLHKALSKNIREWMPKKETFELVENCFSIVKPLQRLDETGYTKSHDTRSEDIEETSDLEEYEEKIDVRSIHEKKNESWLEENFFPCRREANDRWTSGGAKRLNMHIDLHGYQWLLHENPWHLNHHHRVLLVHVINQANYEKALKIFADTKKEYAEICEVMKEIYQRRQLEVLQQSQIVGITTTGAALNRDVLKKLRPKIIFVEEASEILEPQLLAVIEPTIQHLILFGDQYQLSPHVACYELERWHNFGVSMFERLVEHNKMPFQALAVQSRMREEFLPMLLPIYPHLRSNTKLVTGERNRAPACMMSPMYFWSHSYPETRQGSYANEGEATMVLVLLRWMMAEGENPNDITVLAAYRGQVSLLREKLEKYPSAKDIQVHTIDRFQGSENKTIVVSLVRSNEDGDIGFLAKRNRLCVSVSRAKGALYFCGRSETLSKKSPHWKTLVDYFHDRECLGEKIYMRCPRHPCDRPFTICSSDVNSFSPLVCERPCKTILECNHQCRSTCHHGDHPDCIIPVQFVFQDCGHEATKQCSQEEERILCKKETTYTFDACQHTDVFNCWRVMKNINLNCMQVCPKELECGHPCTLKCFENCKANPCGICVLIEKEKAVKEKSREAKELELKLKELENEIERLKLQDDTGKTSWIELDSEGETAAEYWQIRDRTEKFIQPLHGILPIVTKIEKVRSLKLQIKFVETQRDLINRMAPTQLLFHGTSDDGIQQIVEKGFRLPPINKTNMFGQGVYFATDSSKSAQNLYTKGSNKLLLCEVLLGRCLTVQKADRELNKDRIKKKGYDSLFSKREGKETGGTLYDEFVVYDPHQAIPRYIVHYKNLNFDSAAMQPFQMSADQNLTRIQYEMSPNFSGDSPAEYHFRMAESQFFRMSSRNEYKVVMVELIRNKRLQSQYDEAKKELGREKKNVVEERLVFHGTGKEAIEKIIEEGFKIGGEGVEVRNGRAYGSGVYTAENPDISIPYSRGGSMMLLSLALLGEQGKDYSNGASPDVLVLKKAEYLLPKYIVNFTKK